MQDQQITRYLLLLLLCSFLWCFCLQYCAARDTITSGKGNSINSTSNETLISDGKRFELSFLTIDGHSSRYVGIQYYLWKPKAIVWVFNRNNPLPDFAIGFFGIADGNLTLWDENGTSYFSTSLRSSQSTAKLFDSGNLVVSDDQSGKSLWESFDNPTDTFLPGMKMDEKLKLTSWSSSDDPRSGNFTFGQDQNGQNGYIVTRTSGILYWRSRETGSFVNYNQLYDLVAAFLNSSNSISGRISNPPYKSISIPVRNYNNSRLLMNSSGELQYFTWDNRKTRWSSIWSEPRDRCSVYNACGNFGSCNNKNRLPCKCLPGFDPSLPDNWNSGDFSSGCTRNSTICSNKDKEGETFLNLTMMRVGKPDSLRPSEANNEEACRKECLDSCACQAYTYYEANDYDTRKGGPNRHGCWIWTSNLNNLQEESAQDGFNISVRVVASSIGSTRSCKTCGTNKIPYPLSTGPNCGDPMYSNFFCNSSTGQVSFQTLGGNFRVTSINPEARKFAIEVKGTDRCSVRNPKATFLQLSPLSPFTVLNLCYDGKQLRNSNEVEFSWNSPPVPPCTSSTECKDWPNSSCNATRGIKGRCNCNANYQWNGTTLACTQVGSNPKQFGGSGQFGSSKQKHKSISSKTTIIFVVVFFMFVLLCILSFIFYRRRMAAKKREIRESTEGSRVRRLYDTERQVKDLIDSVELKEDEKKGLDVPFFDLESILKATNYFSDENKLGQGGFGPVYKGEFPRGQEIAIKRLSSHSGQGLEEFKNEVVLIAKLQHRNLVRLLGYCVKGDEKILLYEYMPNKSLDTFIFDQTFCLSLDWEKRFNIILGIARGLLYLHQDSRLRIIHRDLKTSNILLDEEMNPKISDFGLARIVGGKETEANTNRVIGTYGYMSPEYALDGLFSIKSDTFSFGVIVLEVVSGRRNTGFYQSELASNLLGYAWRLWKEEKALDLMDQTLLESCNRDEVLKCINIGLLCVQDDPSDRPNMSNVLFMLGSEVATLPNPKEPAFVAKKWISTKPSSSSSYKLETSSNNELTISTE